MKKISYLLKPIMAASLMPIFVPSLMTSCSSTNSWKLTNPDGSLTININLSKNGGLTYSVEKNNKPIVNTSALGMSFSTSISGNAKTYDFSKGLTFVKVTSNDKWFSYDCHSGKTSHVDAHYKEEVITTKLDDLLMDIRFRAMDDGYGFQYSFYKEDNKSETLNWKNEFTQFNIPLDSTTYAMEYIPNQDGEDIFYSYEDYYGIRNFRNILTDKKVTLPFGYDANGYYSFITESGLVGSGYHGSFLQKDKDGILTTIEAPASGKKPEYTVELPFTSPWRVSSVGTYASAFETTIVEDILGDIQEYHPANNPDFNYDWVEPGSAAWSWLLMHKQEPEFAQNNYTMQKQYIDLASQMGWPYVLLDAGWQNGHEANDWQDVKDLTAYAAGKNVKIMVWADAMGEFIDHDKTIETLNWYKRLGIKGVKVDFWDGQMHKKEEALDHQGEDKQTIEQYDDFYKLTAEYEMIVNCHGCNKPTGERRKYPHVLNREAIHGNEMDEVFAGQHPINTVLRSTVGPTDFTPLVKPMVDDVTVGYQMALTVLLESGIPSMPDTIETYIAAESPFTSYYKNLPAAWDESKFLEGSPQTHVVVARRKGNNWWVAGITGSALRTVSVDFSFLDDGIYEATIYNGDDRGREGSIDKTTKQIRKTDKETVDVINNGGFVIELRKK